MDSKIFVPHIPSLTQMATVKEAMNMYNEFHIETMNEAYRRIQRGTSMTSDDSQNPPECNSAQKKLLFFPPHLRKNIMEAIHGLNRGIERWTEEHASVLDLIDGECVFCFRCDGTIDILQTAQWLVLNPNISIWKRFYLACVYCLEETIQALWSEMEAAGQTGNPETIGDLDLVVQFWVKWLRDGCPVNWRQTVPFELVGIHRSRIRLSSVFPSLQPESRKLLVFMFRHLASHDDLRHCLYAMTKEEEEEVLRDRPMKVFCSYLQWPMSSWFLEKAEKIFEYISDDDYKDILNHLLSSPIYKEVFDFHDIIERFWKCSPSHMREKAKESPMLREKIESFFNEIRRKRKADFEEPSNQ